jgi:N-acetylmuramoyl-L-alanine amidase
MTSKGRVTPVWCAKRLGWLLFFTGLFGFTAGSVTYAVVIDPVRNAKGLAGQGCEALSGQDVTLDIARRMQTALQQSAKGQQVELTRQGDYPVSWQERVAMANKNSSFYVVLQLESSPTTETAGLRLYTLQPDITLAAAQKTAPIIEAQKPQSLSSVALKHAAESDRLLTEFEIAMSKNLNLRPHLLRGMFLPLMGVDSPAVMIGLGFLTNTVDCSKLSQENYRQQLAGALASAAVEYISSVRTN